MKLTHTLATLSIAALTLVGCGSTEATSDEPAPEPTETVEEQPMEQEPEYDADNPYEEGPLPAGGQYFFENGEGTVGKFFLPSEPVAEYEELRESVNGEPVEYVTITVDNRNGQNKAEFGGIDAYTEDGRKIEFKSVKHSMTEWQEIAPTDAEGHAGDEWRAIEEVYYDANHTVDIGEVADVVLTTTDELPDEFTRIMVTPQSFQEIAAQPIEVGEAWGIDMDFEAPTD